MHHTNVFIPRQRSSARNFRRMRSECKKEAKQEDSSKEDKKTSNVCRTNLRNLPEHWLPEQEEEDEEEEGARRSRGVLARETKGSDRWWVGGSSRAVEIPACTGCSKPAITSPAQIRTRLAVYSLLPAGRRIDGISRRLLSSSEGDVCKDRFF